MSIQMKAPKAVKPAAAVKPAKAQTLAATAAPVKLSGQFEGVQAQNRAGETMIYANTVKALEIPVDIDGEAFTLTLFKYGKYNIGRKA